MVPVLLLLLLHESLAQQDLLCVNISDHNLTIVTDNAVILDNRTLKAECETDGAYCTFQCTHTADIRDAWFNESSGCPQKSVINLPGGSSKYTILENTTCFLYKCNKSSIQPLVDHLRNVDVSKEELLMVYDMKSSCSLPFDTDSEIKKIFIQVEKKLIHKLMNESHEDHGNFSSYNFTDLHLDVIRQNDSFLNTSGADVLFQTELQPNLFVPEIWMPVNALQSIPQERRTVGLAFYMKHNHFQLDQENITSMVVRIELLWEQRLQGLSPPIKMIFETTPSNMDNDSRLMCHYFDEYDSSWKTDGCETQDNESHVTCFCNHTTPFAVLLIREPISEVHWKILSYISYIGCGLSAFFTALSLVMYAFSGNHKMDFSISIHVSLSGALFLLNTAFMLSEWGATAELEWVCELIAALMHYSLLCCFTWMGIEALHLYLLLIKVFNTYYNHYLLKLSLAGWGIPGVIVATALGLKNLKQFYGKTEVEMYDNEQINKICWITDDTFFYSVNLVYFTLIFIFNSGILMAVASNICKMKQVIKNDSKFKAKTEKKSWEGSERFSASCKSGLTLLGITCLMGTTWGLAFLGSGYVNYPILYLFCILNSLQGFFIFLWICLSVKKQRKREQEDKWTSTPMRTSASKTD